MDNKKMIVATTTFYKSADEVRAQCAFNMAKQVKELGYTLVVVDDSPDERVKENLLNSGGKVFPQIEKGMGASRRQVMRLAAEFAGSDGAICFIEPEKPIIRQLKEGFCMVATGATDIVVLCRTQSGFRSCDKAWEYISYLGNQNFALVTGLSEMDVFLGTRIVSPQMVPFFLKKRENIPGDNSWGVTHYPMLDAIAMGYRVVGMTIDYVHPPEQKAAEESLIIFMKRIEQTALLTAGTTLYAMDLGLIPRTAVVENTCRRMLAIESR